MSFQRFAQLSDEQFATIHAACEAFEEALEISQRSSIELVLRSAPLDIQSDLFSELLSIECEWRSRRGERPTEGIRVLATPYESHPDTPPVRTTS
ncbi:MAG: hypothetical protein KDA60_11495 [Planctomycetales bacterium]|nr:hypothetical protein [Planctomycetales bacterium]